jgi:tetratricopeptide (TPR) repeat protein
MKDFSGNTPMRFGIFLILSVVMVVSLTAIDRSLGAEEKAERLYFPSGRFLKESSLGFREANADYLWFRFIQYYGSFAKGNNNFRHFELLINGITTLDPKFVEAYHFAALVSWSDLGKPYKSIDILKRGILNNPDTARLPFQIGLIYYVVDGDFARAAFWYDEAAKCSDSTDLERRFAAFSRYRSGDNLGSLEMWQYLYETTDQPSMEMLALKMIELIQNKLETRETGLTGQDL